MRDGRDGAGPATVSARLVVGADGRSSLVRKWAGFTSQAHDPGTIIAGVRLENVAASAENSICVLNPTRSRMVLYFPHTPSSGRVYLVSCAQGGVRFRGSADFQSLVQECVSSGLAAAVLDGARQSGPLATFDGADVWVAHPYRRGIVLIGDAGATSDPAWGQGLSLTLRDARVLRDALVADDDWDAARGHTYAALHDQYYQQVRTAQSWYAGVSPGGAGSQRPPRATYSRCWRLTRPCCRIP